MKKFKVTLHLMVDPTRGEKTKPFTVEVEAEKPSEAIRKAEELQTENLTTFDIDCEEIEE